MTTAFPPHSGDDLPNPRPRAAAPSGLPMSQEAMESLPFPLSIYTCDGLLVAANSSAEHLFHVPLSSIIGSFNLLATPPQAHTEFGYKLFVAAVAGEQGKAQPIFYDFSFPGTQSSPDKSCWIEAKYFPFRNQEGHITHVGIISEDVTERIEAEQRMDLLTTLIENANDGIGTTDLAGNVTYCNPAYATLSGYEHGLTGMSISDLYTDDPAIIAAFVAQVIEQGNWRGDMETHCADGRIVPVEISAFLLRNKQGQPISIGAVVRDLRERHSQEQRLRLFENLIEYAPDAVSVMDLDGAPFYANRAQRNLYGYGDEVIGMDWRRFSPPEMEAQIQIIGQQIFSQGLWQGNITQWTKDKQRFQALMSVFLLRDRQGAPNGFAMIGRDVSEQQQREDELSTFKAIIENTPEAVGVLDPSGVILYANPAYQNLLQYTDSIIGVNNRRFVVEEDRAIVKDIFEQVSAVGWLQMQVRFRRGNGSIFPGLATIFLQATPKGEPQIIGFLRDMTDLQQAEAERVGFQQQIIAAQEAALRELSTPLIPIADGVVAMPLIGTIDSNRAQQVLETLLTGVTEMRASTAIIDITGVLVVDTQVANALLRAAQAIKLLGARVLLTGIRPEVAQTLVGLGVNLSGVKTLGTLQAGIAEALNGVARAKARTASTS